MQRSLQHWPAQTGAIEARVCAFESCWGLHGNSNFWVILSLFLVFVFSCLSFLQEYPSKAISLPRYPEHRSECSYGLFKSSIDFNNDYRRAFVHAATYEFYSHPQLNSRISKTWPEGSFTMPLGCMEVLYIPLVSLRSKFVAYDQCKKERTWRTPQMLMS